MTLVFPPLVSRFPFATNELKSLVNKLKKDKVSSTVIEEYERILEQRDKESTGISGIGVLLESHISIHTWPEESFVSIDVFSCKEYEFMNQIQYTIDFFELEKFNVLVIDRFVGYAYDILYQHSS